MFGLENMYYDVMTNNKLSNHYTNIGILSDHVGAGKSYCIMSLLKEAKSITPKNNIQFRDIDIGSSNITKKNINKLDTNLLVVPHSLIGQWSKYLEKSGLKFHSIQKAKDVFELGDETCKFKSSKINTSNDNS